MSQTGDTHKVGKILGLGINKHLHGEIRTELRHAQRSQLTSADILRRDPQSRCILKQGHDLPAVQRNILNRIEAD